MEHFGRQRILLMAALSLIARDGDVLLVDSETSLKQAKEAAVKHMQPIEVPVCTDERQGRRNKSDRKRDRGSRWS